MNLLLFERAEDAAFIPTSDPRTQHLRGVLRIHPGDTCYVGVVNGPRGCARLTREAPEGLHFEVAWQATTDPKIHLDCLIATPRPQTARRILSELTSLGIRRLCFTASERAEPSYAQSSLWASGEWRRHCWQGAEQAFATRLPDIFHADALTAAIARLDAQPPPRRLALDVYEPSAFLGHALAQATSAPAPASGTVLAFGPERGWGPTDRDTLRDAGFQLVHLGERPLRSDTACIAATSLALSSTGHLRQPFDCASLPPPP